MLEQLAQLEANRQANRIQVKRFDRIDQRLVHAQNERHRTTRNTGHDVCRTHRKATKEQAYILHRRFGLAQVLHDVVIMAFSFALLTVSVMSLSLWAKRP
jgi:hypothetical protein